MLRIRTLRRTSVVQMGDKRLNKALLYILCFYALTWAYSKAFAQDFDGSSTYSTQTDAQLACNNAGQAWQDNAFGVTGYNCLSGTFHYNLEVIFEIGPAAIQERFYWSSHGGFAGQIREDLDELTSLTIAINDDLTTAEASIIDFSPRIANLETRADTTDTNIVTLNNEINDLEVDVDLLNDRAALIEIDVNANASDITQIQTDINTINLAQGINSANIANNASAIIANELYIEGVELQQQTYETARAASDAQLSTDIQSQTVALNNSLNAILNEQYSTTQNTSAINSGLNSILNEQYNTSVNTQETNTKLDLLNSYQNTTNAKLQSLDSRAVTQASSLSAINSNIVYGTNTKLDELKTAVEGISFDITGTNISIDNSGVESRLSTNTTVLNNTLNAVLNEQYSTSTKLDQVNTNLTSGMGSATVSSPTATSFDIAYSNFKAGFDLTDLGATFAAATNIANVVPSSPACPSLGSDAGGYFESEISTTIHCDIFTELQGPLSAVILAVWGFLGFRIVVGA